MSFERVRMAKLALSQALADRNCPVDSRHFSIANPAPLKIEISLEVARSMRVLLQGKHHTDFIQAQQAKDPSYRGEGTMYMVKILILYDYAPAEVFMTGDFTSVETAEKLAKKHVTFHEDLASMKAAFIELLQKLQLHLHT